MQEEKTTTPGVQVQELSEELVVNMTIRVLETFVTQMKSTLNDLETNLAVIKDKRAKS